MNSSGETREVDAQPYFIFICSASFSDVFRPTERSYVRLLPPKGKTEVCLILPLENTAISVVPPPRSIKTTFPLFSSSVRTASLEAIA